MNGAGLDVIWPEFATVGGIGAFLFTDALLRFRETLMSLNLRSVFPMIRSGNEDMLTAQEGRARTVALERAIKQRIVQRTGGRIRMLRVEVSAKRIVVHGCAPCYHVRQLVLQGVLDVRGTSPEMRIQLNVAVVRPPSKSAAGPFESAEERYWNAAQR